MKCHACSSWLYLDVWGHWCHPGPCPGYPTPKPARTIHCDNCGHDLAPGGYARHTNTCTPDRPKPPEGRGGNGICPICRLRHTPTCPAVRWSVTALQHRFPHLAAESLAHHCGWTHNEWLRWELIGLSDKQADQCAVRLGLHPALIWGPDWFTAGLSAVDAVFVESGWRTGWLHSESVSSINATEEAAA